MTAARAVPLPSAAFPAADVRLDAHRRAGPGTELLPPAVFLTVNRTFRTLGRGGRVEASLPDVPPPPECR